MPSNKTFSRWVRLTDRGVEKVHEEYLRAGQKCASPEWVWFAGEIVDYREWCSRSSRFPTCRDLVVKALLWLVEKLRAGGR